MKNEIYIRSTPYKIRFIKEGSLVNIRCRLIHIKKGKEYYAAKDENGVVVFDKKEVFLLSNNSVSISIISGLTKILAKDYLGGVESLKELNNNSLTNYFFVLDTKVLLHNLKNS